MGEGLVKPAFILDSAILIDHLRGLGPATKWLSGLRPGEAVISVITRAEVMSGGTTEESASAFDLCEHLPSPDKDRRRPGRGAAAGATVETPGRIPGRPGRRARAKTGHPKRQGFFQGQGPLRRFSL
jgi:hypothetical protein